MGFEDDQPRDDDGRWTSGGGGGDTATEVGGKASDEPSATEVISASQVPPNAEESAVGHTWGSVQGYKNINELLRTGTLDARFQPEGDTALQETQDNITALDSAISSQAPLSSAVETFRSLKGEAADQYSALPVGAVVTDPGFAATTPSLGGAQSFGMIQASSTTSNFGLHPDEPQNTGVLAITVPAGSQVFTPGSDRGSNFPETVLPRGSEFQVTAQENASTPQSRS